MIVNSLGICFFLILVGCQTSYNLLLNGYTKIPKDSDAYTIERTSLSHESASIRYDCIYEEYSMNRNILFRNDSRPETFHYRVLRFYENGCMNIFMTNRDQFFESVNYDPSYFGYRGIVGLDGNEHVFEVYAPSSERGKYSFVKGDLNIHGDTIIMHESNGYVTTYIACEIDKNRIDYQADW